VRILSRNKRNKAIRHHPFLAIDVENNPDTGAFICAGLVGKVRRKGTHHKHDEDYVELYFDNLNALEDYLLSLHKAQANLAFFNASYDKAFIYRAIDGNTVLENDGRVITMRLRNGIKCYELCNFVYGTLEDWIGYLDMGVKFGIRKETLDDLKVRVMSDARATYRLAEYIEDFLVYELGIPMQLTIASCAMRLFTQTFFTDYWKRDDIESERLNSFERKAYYGGRVELFKRGKQSGYSYDVNSMYLSIMRDADIPDMASAVRIDNPVNWRRYFDSYLGIYDVMVTAPEDISIGILPYRREDDGKLIFPTGRFRGTWTSVELHLAEEHGYRIVEVYSFIYYRRSKKYFREYADFVWQKRKEYQESGNIGMDKTMKLVGNSLYGKFAQRNRDASKMLRMVDVKSEDLDKLHRFYNHPVTGEQMVWFSPGNDSNPARFEFPAVSAFITSLARVKLYRAMIANKDDIIYCDTDSVKLRKTAVEIAIGKNLGEWDYEGRFNTTFYRAKFYGDKHKGVPAKAKLLDITDRMARFEFTKPIREKEAIKSGIVPNRWLRMIKHLSIVDDKRAWRGSNSYPLILDIIYNITIIDYIAMDDSYGYDDSMYKTKLLPERNSREDDMTPADRRQAVLAKLDRKRNDVFDLT